MAIKAVMKGYILAIHPTEEVGENNLKVQRVELMVPGYVDDFGDKKGNDEYFLLSVLGDKVKTFDLENKIVPNVKHKAELTVYFNGRKHIAEKGDHKGKFFYSIEGNVNDLRLIP